MLVTFYFPWKKNQNQIKNFKPNMKQFPPLNMYVFFISVCVCWVWVLSGEPLSTDEALTKRKSKQFPVNFSLVFISPQYEFYRFFVLKLNNKNKDFIEDKLISKCLCRRIEGNKKVFRSKLTFIIRVNSFQSISVLFSSVHSMSFIEFLALKLHDEN